MSKHKEELEILKHGFHSFNFIITDDASLSFNSFANMIENHYCSLQAKEIAKIYRKYKGTVSNNKLIIDCI